MSRSRNRKRTRPQPAGQAVSAPPHPMQPPRKRRLRSTYVILGSVGTLFAGLCLYGVVRDRDDDRTCVDANNQVVSDRDCEDGSGRGRWYYGGVSSGGKMNGGSYERAGFGGHGSGGS